MRKYIKTFVSILTSSLLVVNLGISAGFSSIAAEENIDTFAINSDDNKSTFTAIVNVYNEETQETVKGIDVKFVEYDADLPTFPEPQANVVQVLAAWNTSDYDTYEISDVEYVKGHFYAVQIDDIPEGYCYSWEDDVITGIHTNGTLSGDVTYNIALQPHNPLPKLEYPIEVEHELTFSVVDKSTNQVVEGLDVELAQLELDPNIVNKYNYVATVDEWNTTVDAYAVNILWRFESEDCHSPVFGVKINNMPEGYTYYQEPQDGYTLCGFYSAYDYRYDLYKGNYTTECIAYIYPEDEPHVYVTTPIELLTTTTTTIKTSTAATQIENVTTTTSATTTTVANVAGDANCDENVSLADAVLILQTIASPDVYGVDGTSENHITEIGMTNADVYETGTGLTPQDALSVQKYLLKLVLELPE